MSWYERALSMVVEVAEYEVAEAVGCWPESVRCLHVAMSRLFSKVHARPDIRSAGELLGYDFVLCNGPAASPCHATSTHPFPCRPALMSAAPVDAKSRLWQ